MKYLVAAFYKFFDFSDCAKRQKALKQFMIDHDIKGTILIAPEGINGTVSGLGENVYKLLDYLKSDPRLCDLEHKEAYFEKHTFERVKVKLKKHVITFPHEVDAANNAGTYLNAKEWNELLEDPEVALIDTRNHYETYYGSFEGAVIPEIKRFVDLPQFVAENLDPRKHRKVAMYCTGGIRCEKSTAYLKELGFEEVYHLKGGILQYLQDMPKEQSKWNGVCYVFDERVGVDHDLQPAEGVSICPACGSSLYSKDRLKDEYVAGKSCHKCYSGVNNQKPETRSDSSHNHQDSCS
jgi:UPF0176 protein